MSEDTDKKQIIKYLREAIIDYQEKVCILRKIVKLMEKGKLEEYVHFNICAAYELKVDVRRHCDYMNKHFPILGLHIYNSQTNANQPIKQEPTK